MLLLPLWLLLAAAAAALSLIPLSKLVSEEYEEEEVFSFEECCVSQPMKNTKISSSPFCEAFFDAYPFL